METTIAIYRHPTELWLTKLNKDQGLLIAESHPTLDQPKAQTQR